MITNLFSAIMAKIAASDNPMEKWNKAYIYEEQLKPTYHKKKEWMTEEILQLMDTRRKYKNRNPDKYRETHGKIKLKIREAKENWLKDKCYEIERLEAKYDFHNMHKEIRHMTSQQNKTA